MQALKDRVRTFCDLVLGGASLTAAARKVGVKGAAGSVQADRWMKMPAVKAYLAARRAEISNPKILDAKARQEWLSRVILGEEEDTSLVLGEPKRHRASLLVRLRAAELLAKMRGELGDQPAQTNVVYVVQAPQQAATSLEWAREVEAEVIAEHAEHAVRKGR
jgi:hypothetical protein